MTNPVRAAETPFAVNVEQARTTGGARVARVRPSHFAMALTREVRLRRSSTVPQSRKKSIFAAAKPAQIYRFVTEVIKTLFDRWQVAFGAPLPWEDCEHTAKP